MMGLSFTIRLVFTLALLATSLAGAFPRPAYAAVGTDMITIFAGIGTAGYNTASLKAAVVNTAPTAQADSYSTNKDSILTVAAPGVLANDTDVDGDALHLSGIGLPSHGSLAISSNGSFSYTPQANFTGTDSFIYRVSDGALTSDFATVTITINPVNDAPVAVPDSYSINEDSVLAVDAAGVLANDTDVEGSALTAAVVSGPAHGSLSLSSNGAFVYTPVGDYNGSDSFSYQANDGSADSNVATVTIAINSVNDAPVAANDSYSTSEDTALTVVAPGVLGNDTDVEGLALSVQLMTGTAYGSLMLHLDGTFVYTPTANFNGTDSFTYTASDGELTSAIATVTIHVGMANAAPVAVNDSYSTNEDTTLVVTTTGVLGNDSDPENNSLTATVASGPAHGSLMLHLDGTFVYTPTANFNGTDSFTYTASDGQLSSAPATVMISIGEANDAPVCTNAKAFPSTIREAHHHFVPVIIYGCTDDDLDSDPLGDLRLQVTGIFQDEPVAGPHHGHHSADGYGVGTPIAFVRAERDPGGDGRVYHIRFIVTDRDGGQTTGEVLVSVPLQEGSTAIDGGALYDSTAQ